MVVGDIFIGLQVVLLNVHSFTLSSGYWLKLHNRVKFSSTRNYLVTPSV